MKHNSKYKCPTEGAQRQQVEKKIMNVFTPTKENNSEIMINDLDTQFSVIENSVNTNNDNSNADCGNSCY